MTALPWFRFYHEVLGDKKFDVIARMLDYPSPMTVLGIWTGILCLAAQSPEPGKLLVTLQNRYSNADVAAALRLPVDEVTVIMGAFIQFEMIEKSEDDTYSIKNWNKRQFLSDYSTNRVQKHRESADVTPAKRYKGVAVTSPEDRLQITDTEVKRGDAFDEIKNHIEQLTGLPAIPSSIKAINQIIEMGALPEDITAGYEWSRENKGPLRYYSQLVGPTRTSMSKRIDGNHKPNVDPHAGMIEKSPGDWRSPINIPTEEYW